MKLIPYYTNIMYQIYAKNCQTYIANMDIKYIYINMFLMFYHMGCENHNCKDNIYNAF